MIKPIEFKPCPLCGSTKIRLLYSNSGVGGQMMTVTGFAKCENCLTIYQDVAGSTAGFSISESKRLWDELPERLEHMRKHA